MSLGCGPFSPPCDRVSCSIFVATPPSPLVPSLSSRPELNQLNGATGSLCYGRDRHRLWGSGHGQLTLCSTASGSFVSPALPHPPVTGKSSAPQGDCRAPDRTPLLEKRREEAVGPSWRSCTCLPVLFPERCFCPGCPHGAPAPPPASFPGSPWSYCFNEFLAL
jgi:hypothetical protein